MSIKKSLKFYFKIAKIYSIKYRIFLKFRFRELRADFRGEFKSISKILYRDFKDGLKSNLKEVVSISLSILISANFFNFYQFIESPTLFYTILTLILIIFNISTLPKRFIPNNELYLDKIVLNYILLIFLSLLSPLLYKIFGVSFF